MFRQPTGKRSRISTLLFVAHCVSAQLIQQPFAAHDASATAFPSSADDAAEQLLLIQAFPITLPLGPLSSEYLSAPLAPQTSTTMNIPIEPSSNPAPPLSTTGKFLSLKTDETPSFRPSPTASLDQDAKANHRWASSPHLKDLSSFKITHFPGPKSNLAIVNGIPPQASGLPPKPTYPTSESPEHVSTAPSEPPSSSYGSIHNATFPPWDNSTSVLQVFYPKGSINPDRKSKAPMGGSQFYASPIDLSNAKNVTFGYSIFFPRKFDWVLGGKLPGLYGGHTGCSGGDEATDCFSTRLMWRAEGAGELYLYAPKNKQTPELCSDPRSTCDADYGFSIGRGAFSYRAGNWTTLTQTVVLNTLGNKTGLSGLSAPSKNSTRAPTKTTKKKTTHSVPTTGGGHGGDDDNDDGIGRGGLLGPILGGVLGNRKVLERDEPVPEQDPTLDPHALVETTPTAKAVPMTGIFFSTFFGGHGEKYATPKDQHVWFKDFFLIQNS